MTKQEVIYSITCLSNTKVYIGRTCCVQRRKREHFKRLDCGNHCNKHLQYSFNKYGKDSFVFSVIEVVKDTCVKNRELFWFNKMKEDGVSLFNNDMTASGGVDSKSVITRTYIFDVISKMHEDKNGIKEGAKIYKTSSATILNYIPEWESQTGNKFCRTPQEDACLERMVLFVEDWWEHGDTATRNLKKYKLSHQALVKHLPKFGLQFDDVRLDKKFKETKNRVMKALEDVEQGVHFTTACKNNEISIQTYYKYKALKEKQ